MPETRMQKAIESFEQDFARWSLHLPETDVAGRRSGTMQAAGWHVLYNFGRDSRGEFLDYYAALRDGADDAVTDDWHVRLYDTGERVPLPMVLEAYMYARDPTPEELVRARRHLAESGSATNDAPVTAAPTGGAPSAAAVSPAASQKSTTRIPPLTPVVRPLRVPPRVAASAPAASGVGASLATPRQATATRTAHGAAPGRASQETASGPGNSPASDAALEVGLDLALADIEPILGGDTLAAWMVTPTGVPTVKPHVDIPAAKPILTVRITAPKLVPIRPAAPRAAVPPFTAASNGIASPSSASAAVAPAMAPGTAAPRRLVPRPAVPTPIASAPVVTATAVEAPVVEAPVVEVPLFEALVVEQAVVKAPVVVAPVVVAPAVEAPAVEALFLEDPGVSTPAVEAPLVEAPLVELLVLDEHILDEPVARVDAAAGVVDLGLVSLYDDDAPSGMLRVGDATASHADAADLMTAELMPVDDDAPLVLEAESVSIGSHVGDTLPDRAAADNAPAPELVFLTDTHPTSIEPAANAETITAGDSERSHDDDPPPLLAMLTAGDDTPASADHVITGLGEWTPDVAPPPALETPAPPKRRSPTPDGVLDTTDMAVVAGSFDPWWYRPGTRRLVTIAVAAAAVIIVGSAVAHHRTRSAPADNDARTSSSAGARSSGPARSGASSNQSDSDDAADSTGNTPNTPSDTLPVAPAPPSVVDDPAAPATEEGMARPAGPRSLPPIQTSGTARAAVGTGKGAARIAPASP
jgi:hypothetical protein